MQVLDRLPALSAAIRYEPETVGTMLRAQLRGDREEVPECRGISVHDIFVRGPRNHQQMYRRLGRDVGKGHAHIVFVHQRHGQFAACDFPKNCIGHNIVFTAHTTFTGPLHIASLHFKKLNVQRP